MIGPLSRIIARYIAGALVTYGLFTPQDAAVINPDLVFIIGMVLGGIVELAYTYAKRVGWMT